MGPLIDAGAVARCEAAVAQAVASGGERALRRRAPATRPGYFVEPAIVVGARTNGDDRAARDLRADPLRDRRTTTLRRGHRAAERRAAGPVVGDLHRPTCARPSASSSAGRLATAASPTSTSAPRAPRSAAPSAARRKPAAAASRAPTPGRPTCAARPTPSTTAPTCRWRRASSSGWADGSLSGPAGGARGRDTRCARTRRR